MLSIKSISIAPAAQDWLANSSQPRILHVFDRVCNLINERVEVLSIVNQRIGNGPFNLVINDDILFSEHLNAHSAIFIHKNQLFLGDLAITTRDANRWSPRPDWEALHTNKDNILTQLMFLQTKNHQPLISSPLLSNSLLPNPLLTTLCHAITTAELSSALGATRRLAGLGQGLTPAGDDFLMGAMLAAWIIHPLEIASALAEGIANTAAPLTTSLSASWLRSAGRGEAGILWHKLFAALINADAIAVQGCIDRILEVGHTSGADALAGFIGLFKSRFALSSSKKVISYS